MNPISSEIIRRFPEITEHLYGDDEDHPYTVAGAVADWLKSLTPVELTPEIVQRVVDFRDWICEQPSGKSAEDDPASIYFVGIFEELFESEVTRPLIPKLYTKELLLEDPAYWERWVGAENYRLALEQF